MQTAYDALKSALGDNAQFRDGQVEAIEHILTPGSRQLLVQRTGWGKSVVYFIATQLLRNRGLGSVILVSPLLSLMRNQQILADRCGLNVVSINSSNRDDWEINIEKIINNTADIVLISPERLGNPNFAKDVMPILEKKCSLLVVDEAHCISDWGHDFRPDYKRIVKVVQRLSPDTRILATTATANNRVIADIKRQLGDNLAVKRGKMTRQSLRLRALRLNDQAERLAWMAKYIPKLKGSGIIYCLTVNDCNRVAEWLQLNGIDAHSYNADMDSDSRIAIENDFYCNKIQILVATTALGMGYDKPDIGFVVHFQLPSSIIAYYQQIGRAGRALDIAEIVLLTGLEDQEIHDYFIRSAFPSKVAFQSVLEHLEAEGPVTITKLLTKTNITYGAMERVLKLLEVEEVITHSRKGYEILLTDWDYEQLSADKVTEQRYFELNAMKNYVDYNHCRMSYLSKALDDDNTTDCGKCDRCGAAKVPLPPEDLINSAQQFLKRSYQCIEPRKQLPSLTDERSYHRLAAEKQLSVGIALSVYGDAGWGRIVAKGKYELRHFPDELIPPSVNAIHSLENKPDWLTWVPSTREPELVKNFALRLAAALEIPAHEAVKASEHQPQKTMMNSNTQYANAFNAFSKISSLPGNCLLIDDVIDSGWTMTAIGIMLKEAGCDKVIPFALASAKTRQNSRQNT